MLAFLRSWILNIVTLVIFILLLEIIAPSGRVKKFINLVSGFILIIALINPVLEFIGKDLYLKQFQLADSSFLDRREIERNSSILKEEQMKQITELYRKKLIRQIEESIGEVDGIESVKADVIINEDYNSDSFGEIKRIYLDVRKGEKTGAITPVEEIEKIEINNRKAAENDEADDVTEKMDSAIRDMLEEEVSKLFGVDRENIVVNLE